MKNLIPVLLAVLLIGCSSPVPTPAITSELPEGSGQAAEPDVLGELIPGYICFEAWAVLEYEDLEVGGRWVDFLREGKVIDDAVIPWVVSARSSSVRGAEPPYDQVRRFCIPRSEDPGFGRGPHPVSEVVVP